MKIEELITALRRLKVETGSLPCLGCGYEHGCSLHGCVIINEALERITMLKEHFSEESALKMAAQALETTPEALRQSAQFHAGDTVWVLTRDEDGVPDDVDGYMLLAVRPCWQRRDCTRRSAMMRESGALNRGSFRANTQLFHPFYNIRFRPHFYVQKPNMPE